MAMNRFRIPGNFRGGRTFPAVPGAPGSGLSELLYAD